MADHDEMITALVEDLAAHVVVLEPGDLMAYGDVLTQLEQLVVIAEGGGDPAIANLSEALKSYLEGMILGQVEDQEAGVDILGQGVQIVQAVLRGDSGPEQINEFLAAHGFEGGGEPPAQEPAPEPEPEPAAPEPEPEPQTAAEEAPPEPQAEPEPEPQAAAEEAPPEPEPEPTAEEAEPEPEEFDMGTVEVTDEEDKELLLSFVAEALEHLESIEINTLLLEDDPQNLDTLNAVFRPFHTIKGVSGFLNLKDINHLSHQLENLLDKARSGEIVIGGMATDVILAGVDLLTQMITESQNAINENRPRRPFAMQDLIDRIGRVLSDSSAEAPPAQEEKRVPPLGEVLVEDGVVEPEQVAKALDKQKERPEKPLGELLVHTGAAGPGEVADAVKKQKTIAGPSAGVAVQEVKIDTAKLDNLLDMVGELVIAQSMVQANPKVQAINDRKLASDMGQLARITSELQKSTMSMRMVPIKQTFQRMVRVVRDTAKKQGKKVRLELEGEGTEIDRNMVEKFYDPLVHMVRNSVDHGIEPPDERREIGKPPEGLVVLAAYHQGGNVCIEIRDDGKGLDRDKILSKAIERGLADESDSLSDEEIFSFIFHPGFSTADQVTDISGRGVGMDVVQKTIDSLRGKVSVKSSRGQGTTLTIALPLTLAIIDGMVVQVGNERFILPTVSVLESLRPTKEDYSTVKGRGEMIMIRGNLLPLIRLDEIVNVQAEHKDPWEGLVVVVEHHGSRRCLMVDHLIGRQEVVIKSLGEHLKMVKVVAGGAIMGDGRVGLILDIDGIFKALEGR